MLRKFRNKIESFGSELKMVKINQKAILKLKNKHAQIKHLDKCHGKWAKGLSRHFTNEASQIGPLDMKRCSTTLIIKRMKIIVRRGLNQQS